MSVFTASAVFTAVDKFSRPLGKMTAALKKLQFSTSKTAKRLKRYNTEMTRLGATTLKAVVGIGLYVVAMRKIVSAGAKFETAMLSLSALTGLQGEQLNLLELDIKSMSTQYVISSNDVAKAFELVGSAKPELLKNAEGLKAVTEASMLLSNAGTLPLASATDSLTSIMNQFNQDASQAGKTVDILAAAAVAGSSPIRMTADAMKEFGSSAKLSGISVQESAAAIHIGTKFAGKSGARFGRMMKVILTNLETQKIDKFKPSIVGLSTAFDNLNKAGVLKDVDMQKKLFGVEALSVGVALSQYTGELKSMTLAVDASGQAQVQSDIKLKSLEKRWEKFTIVIENLITSVFPSLKSAIMFVVEPLTKLAAWIQTNETAMAIFKVVAVSAIIAFSVAVLGLTIHIIAMNAALWANPIVWIIAGVILGIGIFIAQIIVLWNLLKKIGQLVGEWTGWWGEETKLEVTKKEEKEENSNSVFSNISTSRNEIVGGRKDNLDISIDVKGKVENIETKSTSNDKIKKTRGNQLSF